VIARPPTAETDPTALSCERMTSTQHGIVDESDFVRAALQRKLQSIGLFPLRQVRSFIEDGVVVLCGTVRSYHEKQLVQEVAMQIAPTLRVENRCEVS